MSKPKPNNRGGKLHLQDLEQSEELFRLLVEQVTDSAIFALHPNGHIVTWNSGAELLKGYRAKEIIGQHIERFYTEVDRQANRPRSLLKQAREHGRVEDEGWRVRKDGSRFWANVIITALFDDSKHLRGYAKITRDLSDRRETEESLRATKDILEKRVLERTAELKEANSLLEERIAELEQFHDVVVGRELKLIELEKEIERLRRQTEGIKASGADFS